MSTTSRIGFLLPDNTDLADENVYYDPNITVFETELPTVVVSSLPGSGNWAGRMRSKADSSAATNWSNPAPLRTWSYDGTAWRDLGNVGSKLEQTVESVFSTSTGVNSSGGEVFQSSQAFGLASISALPNTAFRFHCEAMVRQVVPSGTGGTKFNGKFNIFIDPNSSVSPTPTTPGAIRLSFPIEWGDNNQQLVATNTAFQYLYGELFYNPQVSSPATLGAAVYLSSTGNSANTSTGIVAVSASSGVGASRILIESMGVAE